MELVKLDYDITPSHVNCIYRSETNSSFNINKSLVAQQWPVEQNAYQHTDSSVTVNVESLNDWFVKYFFIILFLSCREDVCIIYNKHGFSKTGLRHTYIYTIPSKLLMAIFRSTFHIAMNTKRYVVTSFQDTFSPRITVYSGKAAVYDLATPHSYTTLTDETHFCFDML